MILLAMLALGAGVGSVEAGFNQWTTGGPPNVSILSLAIDPLTPRIVYAGSNGDGIFRSSDGGASWIQASDGLTSPVVGALAVNPLDPSVVYAGTNGGGVFRSVDFGASWVAINSGLTNGIVTALAINPALPTTIYAGTTGGGVFRSASGGNSWSPANSGLPSTLIAALAVNPKNPNIVYASVTGQGIFRSLDAGASWTAASTGLLNSLVSSIAIDPLTPNTLYVGTTGGGVFKSVTSAAQWTPVNSGIANTIISSLAIDARVPTTVYASAPGTGVFQSTNGGLSWSTFSTGLTNTIVNALAATPTGLCVHAATRGTGVFDFALSPAGCALVPVAAAVLPSSRSVLVGAAATAFATIVNPMPFTAVDCGISRLSVVPAALSFQTTDPATNELTGTPNTPVSISAGGLQTYVISLTPSAPMNSVDVRFDFGCVTSASAPIIIGVNTLLLSASTTSVPDIVALAASDGGIVNIPGNRGTGVFAVATINMGAGDTITVSADTGGNPLPLSLAVCETNAAGNCLAPPGPPVTRVINPGETPTFGIFVTGNTFIPYDPAVRRIFVRFTDPGGQTRGSTSVAVRTQ